jgi:hypothetical protein
VGRWWQRIRAWWLGAFAEEAPSGWESLLNPILLDALYAEQVRDCYLRLHTWEATQAEARRDARPGVDDADDAAHMDATERVTHLLRVLLLQTQCLAHWRAELPADDPKGSHYQALWVAQCVRIEGYVADLEGAPASAPLPTQTQVMRDVSARATTDIASLRWVMPRSQALLTALCDWGHPTGH